MHINVVQYVCKCKCDMFVNVVYVHAQENTRFSSNNFENVREQVHGC